MTVWPTAVLGDLVQVRGGGTPRRTNPDYYGGTIPWVTPKDMRTSIVSGSQVRLTDAGVVGSPARLIPSGSVLVVVRSGVLKHTLPVALTTAPVTVNQDMKALTPRSGLDSAYLARVLKARSTEILSWVRATTADNFPTEKLLNLRIPLPPVEEQRRIAAILDQADALRIRRRATIDHLNDLGQAIFHAMFGPAGRYPKQKFGDLVREFRYGTSNKSREGGGYPALRIPNVIGGHLDLADLKTVPVTETEYSRLALREGDLLFVRTNGNPHNVGRCAVVEDYLLGRTNDASDQFIYASYLIRARLDADAIDPTFARVYLSSPAGRRQLRERSKTSAGQFNINIAGLESIALPAVPIDAQRAFAHHVQSAHVEEEIHRRSALVFDELFISLQALAFSGQL